MKLKNLFFTSAIAVWMVGCSPSTLPPIYSPQAMDVLIKDVQLISKKFKVEEILYEEKEELMNEFGTATIRIRDDNGKIFEQTLYYNTKIPHTDPEPARDPVWMRDFPKSVNINDIIKQKTNLEKYVQTAITLIEEGVEEGDFIFEGVSRLIFSSDDNGDLIIKFTINLTEKGTKARTEGNKRVIDYYAFDFMVDKDGEVSYIEE